MRETTAPSVHVRVIAWTTQPCARANPVAPALLPPVSPSLPPGRDAEACAPQLDTYVFARVGGGVDGDLDLEGGEVLRLVEGDVHVLRYPAVQALVGHQLELI